MVCCTPLFYSVTSETQRMKFLSLSIQLKASEEFIAVVFTMVYDGVW